MSQYPPYQPHDYGYVPPGSDPRLVPARRAGVLMIILGALHGACGLLMGLGSRITADELPAEQAKVWRQLDQQLAEMGVNMQAMLTGIAMVTGIVALVLVVLGILVRKGGRGPIIGSIVAVSLLVLMAGFPVILNLAGGGAGQTPAGICMMVVLLGLYVLALVWLIQALNAPSSPPGFGVQFAPGYMPPPGYTMPPGQMPSPPPGQGPMSPQWRPPQPPPGQTPPDQR